LNMLGLDTPEAVVKLSENQFYVIESKSTRTALDQAVNEAVEYAEKINKSDIISAPLISGVAGNSADDFIVRSFMLKKGEYVPITMNDQEITSLIHPEISRILLTNGNPSIKDVPIDEKLFLSTAEKINEILHNGAINKNYRARVMAALLLSMLQNTKPDVNAEPQILIQDINARVKYVLDREGKGEFIGQIELALPPTSDNHIKFKGALVQTLHQLEKLNIRSAMKSGADVLGSFYEVFLKYGNGAKEIGIVLTPRHITRFGVNILDIKISDIVYDPTCGTGGFLVSAFDHIKKSATTSQINKFKKYNIFGVDQESEVVALAIVNMIFRGDGKNNIIEGNCLHKILLPDTIGTYPTAKYVAEKEMEEVLKEIAESKRGDRAVTKVLMNPPFALKSNDEKEYRFVQHALDQMDHGGLLFSVLPLSSMFEGGEEKEWRLNKLLNENTLLAVITFPPELFYPVGTHTLGIIVKKGAPHPSNQGVFWGRAVRDGFVKVKGKRLPSISEPNDFATLTPLLQAFIQNPSINIEPIPKFYKIAPIDYKDPLLELIPERYIDSLPFNEQDLEEGMDRLVREQVSFIVRFKKEDEYEGN